VAAFAALSTAVMALPAAAATQTGTETVTLTAGSLSIAGCGTCSAALSGPVGPLAIVGGAPAAIWTDATGSGTGWDGTLQATTMVYTGNWAQTGGTTTTLAATTAGAYSDTLDGIEYTVTVSAGGTGTTTPYTWTSTDTTDHAGGSGSATNGTAKAVGTMGVTITFASGTAYPSGAIYMVKVGAFPASALALNTVNFAVTPQTGTTSGVPLSINNGTTVPGGGSAVKFVTAAANTGMGAYQVTPGVQVTPDASTWAGVAYASTLTYTIVSGP
jgi:hypothetical protein